MNLKTKLEEIEKRFDKKFIRVFDKFEVSDDASFRAITPQGFAKAFYEANK